MARDLEDFEHWRRFAEDNPRRRLAVCQSRLRRTTCRAGGAASVPRRTRCGAGALQPAHDLAQCGGVEGAGEVADDLVVVVGERVEAGTVEGGVEGLGGGARELAVGGVGGPAGLVGGLGCPVGDVAEVAFGVQRVLEGGVVVGVVALGSDSGPAAGRLPR
ncbi:hypothetical protein [Kitasatospora sp. NPDC050463]|uniref:hypothetical protein n=1 Tax=Kitasatospora sp. NPDC050463 TaxID=3155786 RepID=UPI0033C6D9BC